MRGFLKIAAMAAAALTLAGGMALAQGQGAGPGAGSGMRAGQGMSQGMGPGMGQGMGQGAGILKMLDKNGDGAVSREEFVDAPRGGPGSATDIAKEHRVARFQQLDRNGDGKLTAEELAAVRGQ